MMVVMQTEKFFLNVIKATDENWNKHNSFYLVVGGYLKLKTSAKEKKMLNNGG